ncbi:MAG: PEP-CTERM sorting domain-containing protein [Planctomycetes bacterium]|nr:PEP-CTERM sorting domain-containing protein [Planctomycetota bacterium]
MTRCSLLLTGLAVALAVVGWCASAQAGLVVDLRFADNSTSLIITPAMIGTDVTGYVWANVTGAVGNPALEGLSYVSWSVWSGQVGGGAVMGDITGRALSSPTWNVAGSGQGTIQSAPSWTWDLNTPADGLNDWGSKAASSNTDVAKARATSMTYTGGEPIPDGQRWNVATLTFHIDSAILGDGTTKLNVVMPPWGGGMTKSANWAEDAVTKTGAGTAGTSLSFTLEPTQVSADAHGDYIVDMANPPVALDGTGQVTAGFGSIANWAWDLDGLPGYETPGPAPLVSYEMLKTMGYEDNVPRLARFMVGTNDGKSAMDETMITIVPEPATIGLVALGLAALVGRRRVR